jgi:hypothetical protein
MASCELVDTCLGEVLQHEVLEQMNAIDGECDVVDRQTDRFIRIGSDLDRRVVTAQAA